MLRTTSGRLFSRSSSSRRHGHAAAASQQLRRMFGTDVDNHHHLSKFATQDPNDPVIAKSQNLLGGEWVDTQNYRELPDPLTGKPYIKVPETSMEEAQPFVDNLKAVPRSGLHNMFKNKDRMLMLGGVNRKVAEVLHDTEVFDFFTDCIVRSVPKSRPQAAGEIRVMRSFFENFSGDNVRFLHESFGNAGDHAGQFTAGYRFPYGGVGVVTPFNFPLEISILQTVGAIYMGNRPTVKPDQRCSFPYEQFVRLLHYCGLPKSDLDLVHCDGPVAEHILTMGDAKLTVFTGSSKVGEHLVRALNGKVRLEDGGYDWKILGPDVPPQKHVQDAVGWQCDHDAFGHSGQKCSAQSIMFMHRNWKDTSVLDVMQSQAVQRNLTNLTIGPVITWTTEAIQDHVDKVLELPSAELLFGGEPLKEKHSIPSCYGAYQPTAIRVPLEHFANDKYHQLLTTELFGPFTLVVEYGDNDVDGLLELLEDLPSHLTAGVVSNDAHFVDKVLGCTINGTTYAGIRARTTGAPQNMFFGPSGDPRGAGIHTVRAIRDTWSHHREVLTDVGPLSDDWTVPPPV